MMYSIGVIIPVYNMEKYLHECLESIVEQTILFDEVIIINDGSSDRSQIICEKYCKKYSYIQLINQENKGLSVARNVGINYSKSDYLIFLDSDDYLFFHTVEILKQKLNGQDILFYSANIKEEIKEVKHSNNYQRNQRICNRLMTGKEFFNHVFPKNYIVSACMGAYNRNFLTKYKILFPERLYYEDNFFTFQVISKAKKIECISDELYIRRYRSGSIMTSDLDEKKYLDRLDIQLKIWDYIKGEEENKLDPSFLKKYVFNDLWQMIQFEIQLKDKKTVNTYNKKVEYLYKFLDYWIDFCDVNELSFSKSYILLNIYRELYKVEKKYLVEYENIKKKFIFRLQEKLKKLRLDEPDIKVGIYGIGNHSKKMFKLYELFVSQIICKYIYIVSDENIISKDDKEHQIISYKNIPNSIDFIIVSSLTYMDDMVENLKNIGIVEKKIHKIYDSNDMCDFVMAYDFIEKCIGVN